MGKNFYLPAEWHAQSYIQLTWPHVGTDWNYMLEEVESCFLHLAQEIAARQPLLLVAPEYPKILENVDFRHNIHFIACPTKIHGHATTASSQYFNKMPPHCYSTFVLMVGE